MQNIGKNPKTKQKAHARIRNPATPLAAHRSEHIFAANSSNPIQNIRKKALENQKARLGSEHVLPDWPIDPRTHARLEIPPRKHARPSKRRPSHFFSPAANKNSQINGGQKSAWVPHATGASYSLRQSATEKSAAQPKENKQTKHFAHSSAASYPLLSMPSGQIFITAVSFKTQSTNPGEKKAQFSLNPRKQTIQTKWCTCINNPLIFIASGHKLPPESTFFSLYSSNDHCPYKIQAAENIIARQK